MKPLYLLLLLVAPLIGSAQSLLRSTLPVTEGAQKFDYPFAGGLLAPQFSQADLNGDSLDDLYIFDRASGESRLFLRQPAGISPAYKMRPDLASGFPKLEEWVLLRDYNCDGLVDIFTSSLGSSYIRVFRNESSGDGLVFRLVTDTLTYTLPGDSFERPLYVLREDLPGIVDLDGDGDMDILTFDPSGAFLGFFENRSQDVRGDCDSLGFELTEPCWGQFEESGVSGAITKDISCKGGGNYSTPDLNAPEGVEHAGSTVSVFDYNGDGVHDVLLGDISSDNLVYLRNAASNASGLIDTVNYQFPSAEPVSIELFLASFHVDVNFDGRRDLLVAPNLSFQGANYEQVWLYEDVGTGPEKSYRFLQDDFLQAEMIDVGRAARPAVADLTGDGLPDLLLGNYSYSDGRIAESRLTLLVNTGSANEPRFELVDRDYLDIGQYFSRRPLALSPTLADLDGDGDVDLLVGEFSGNLFFFRNTANPGGAAQFVLENSPWFNINVGVSVVPAVADLNDDGKPDLVLGEASGRLNYFENRGTATNPQFNAEPDNDFFGEVDILPTLASGYSHPFLYKNANDEWEMLVGTETGEVRRFGGIAARLAPGSGAFTTLDSAWGNLSGGQQCGIVRIDLNDDGFDEVIFGQSPGGVELYTLGQKALANDAFKPVPDLAFRWNGRDRVVFDGPLRAPAQLVWVDLLGRTHGSVQVARGQSNARLTAPTNAGLYVLMLRHEGQVTAKKFWIE